MSNSIYDFSVKRTDENEQSLKDFEGNVMVIVNTASKCGFTPQFKELQSLYETYKDQGLMFLGFPSSQFNNQEFDEINETLSFCQVNYGVTFPMYKKVDVKGSNADPLFKFLTSEKKGLLNEEIKWNFTKFLIDRNGKVVKRYAPQTNPKKMEEDIQSLLHE
ncbi:glutathione peroxidase [Chungangia koreensis]|uniref:Glutathione peroxidase n=1 Tax=Chungangia koreensis TaxID=752657 RepID=A0ABV8X2S0_9LACT